MTEGHRPTVHDVDPNVMAVNSMPDELRTHADPDETEVAQIGDGSVAPVDLDDQKVEQTEDDGTGVDELGTGTAMH